VLHRLAAAHRATTPEAVAASLVALHSTDPASVHLAVAARTAGGGASVADIEEETSAALARLGEARTTELTPEVPALKRTVRYGGTSKWAADVGLSSRIVLLLTCDGRIVRTRPRGTWTSTQHRYALAPAAGEPMETAEAQAELARRWLTAFGVVSSGPVGDLKRWAGWTVAATKRALAAAPADTEPPDAVDAEPWAALVPSLDPTMMGWKDRSWYLGGLAPQLFDRNGNAGPTIWWSGRVVGGWAQRSTGEVVTRVLVDIGRDGAAAVEAEAARLQGWLDGAGAVVKPRFPTPLQKELAG